MSYQTNRDKIKEFIDLKLIPILKKKDLDYYKVVDLIGAEIGASKNMVEEVLYSFFQTGKMKEERIITVTRAQLSEILKEIREDEEEANKILQSKPNA